MVKKFTVDCDFAGKKIPVTFFVGNAAVGNHPIGFQSAWLGKEKGGSVPEKLMASLSKLKEISDKNKVSFEDLCGYVIDEINSSQEVVKNLENNNKKENQGQNKA